MAMTPLLYCFSLSLVILKSDAALNSTLTKSPNIALFKPAYQSATYLHICGWMYASFAVNGDPNPDVNLCQCSHTAGSVHWLAVDLQAAYKIDYVTVYNRISGTGTDRLNYFIVRLGHNAAQGAVTGLPLCGMYKDRVPSAAHVSLKCSAFLPAYRHVIIQQSPTAPAGGMAVCELEVYALTEDRRNEFILEVMKETRVTGYNIQTINSTKNWFACFAKCREITCTSFNHNQADGLCELNLHLSGYDLSALQSVYGWKHYTAIYAY